ncbi:phage portal protein [Listeria newyorkensis]|uniref:Phage portal protein n=1 Tax=Listeria newyorkensis TaxID=1497681 RepID=A0A841YZW9_9LIST|nr:phage portal protein [Listeria newyorkensis]MBC1459064.1 phage portal protein [Listeria newyorkensis]
MFKKIINKIKGVLYRMKIIRGVELQQKVDIPIDQSFYDNIAKWRCWYQGFYNEYHTIWYFVQGIKKQRNMLTMGMAKQVSQEMANMICNEKMEVSFDNEAVGEFVSPILEANGFIKNTQDNAEFMMALGGMAAEIYTSNGDIKVSYVPAESFIPLSWDVNKEIDQAIIVVEQKKVKDFNYTLLRWHEKKDAGFVVRNELYRASINDSSLGTPVELSFLYPDLEEMVEFPTATRPFFAYCKPAIANNVDSNVPLGISIFANAIDTLKSIDRVFDSLEREFRIGGKRAVVPDAWLKGKTDVQTGNVTRYFDTEDEIFQGMRQDENNQKYYDVSPELRVSEHISALDAYLKTLSTQTGFSAATFGFDITGLRTATEVVSENSKTFRSKQSHENNIEVFVGDIVESLLLIADHFGMNTYPTEEYEVTTTFDDSIINDKDARINQQVLLKGSGLQSKKRAIMAAQDVDETTALEILAEIEADEQRVIAEGVDPFGVE